MTFPIISSNTLFHFTSNRDHLTNILTNDFRPRFCLETFGRTVDLPETTLSEFAFPMTCFCDLPLSNIGKHLSQYGNYGIGLTKEWGMENGLNPILYVHKDSNALKSMEALGVSIFQRMTSKVNLEEFPEVVKAMIATRFYYTKPYIGNFLRNGDLIRDVRFYDEREWRYVPLELLDKYHHLTKVEFLDMEKRQEANNCLPESTVLKFTPDDIRYIIVATEGEILDMVDDILRIKGDKYSHNQLRKLTTRIISAEQIREDF